MDQKPRVENGTASAKRSSQPLKFPSRKKHLGSDSAEVFELSRGVPYLTLAKMMTSV
jgi:hypothetical protein